MLLICLKSVSWTGNELADGDIENCGNSQLTHRMQLTDSTITQEEVSSDLSTFQREQNLKIKSLFLFLNVCSQISKIFTCAANKAISCLSTS